MYDLPQYVLNALRKGLKLRAAGHAGKGLQPETVRAARSGIARGAWSGLKIMRAAAWFARHKADRERMNEPAKWDDPPKYSPAYVAWLLWGSDSDNRGRAWVEKKAKQIREEKEKLSRHPSTKAPPKDRIKGGKNTGRADTKSRAKIELNERTNKALRNLADEHNEENKASSKRATLRTLQKVYLRGAGAFSGSHRPGITRAQWSFGRVRAFLYLLKNGRPKSAKYITDNDLLPEGHPKAPKRKAKS